METLSYPTDGARGIVLEISGNLKAQGWDQPEIQAGVSGKETLKFSEEDGRVVVRSWGNTRLQLPEGLDIRIAAVEGNATLAGLGGAVQIARIGGNLKLRQVGEVEIEKVYGNTVIREAAGDVSLGEVYGNLAVSGAAGRVSAKKAIKGNMVLSWIQGASAVAMGNTTLSVQALEMEDYAIEASGNIHCYLAPGSNAAIRARSSSGSIRLDLPGRAEKLRETEHKFQLGEGGATISLAARGYVHIAVREPEPDFSEDFDFDEVDEINDEINHLIEQQMNALERQINERLSHIDAIDAADLTTDIDEIVDQAREYSTLAALEAQSRAEAAAQRAQAKLAIKLKKAKSRSASAKKYNFGLEGRKRRGPGTGAAAAGRGNVDEVSDEERLLVLKMVEENKISLDEAEELLAALDGRGD